MAVSSIMLIRSGTEENLNKQKRFVEIFQKMQIFVFIGSCIWEFLEEASICREEAEEKLLWKFIK